MVSLFTGIKVFIGGGQGRWFRAALKVLSPGFQECIVGIYYFFLDRRSATHMWRLLLRRSVVVGMEF